VDTDRVRTNNEKKIRWARLSIASNTLLVIFKFAVGFASGSVSIISEAIHSTNDLVAAIVAWLSVRKSSMPPDRNHTYGHGKIENLSGTFEAILIFVAALLIIIQAIRRMATGATVEFLEAGILVMLISSVLNYFVSKKLLIVARETESVALEADGWHLRTDVYTSAGVFFGLFLIRVTGIHILDPIIAILVALTITKAAYDLTRKSLFDLMDASIEEEDRRKIIRVLEEHYPQYLDFHDLRTRRSGSQIHIDLHLTVYKMQTIKDAHDITEHLEHDIKEIFPDVSVIIHVEPCNGECNRCTLSCEKKDS
jgi:cation diffusion facilitator family transporter